jgi:hypothetical protein
VLVEDMLLDVAAGWEWFGQRVTQGLALCFARRFDDAVQQRVLATGI